jgi:tetratricopeptide (TPR) repeat protein
MKRFALLLILVAALAVAAAPATDTEALLREGNAAFRRGDYAAAAEAYEGAGLRTTEPALIAFNLAATKYRSALESAEGRARNLEEGERYFRCCLGDDDPRRGRALQFLGVCLLQQALDGDGGRAEEAITRLEECLLQPGLDDESADDARHNLALARLVFAQVPPPPPESSRPPEKPAGDETRPNKPQPRERRPVVDKSVKPNGDPASGRPDQRARSGDIRRDMDRTGNDYRDSKAGRENTERGPDGEPIDPADVRYLKDAFDRIMDEQQAHKRKKAPPAAPGVKDW